MLRFSSPIENPPPMPDYVSPFAKKRQKKEPIAMIRMKTRNSLFRGPHDDYIDDVDVLRSRVDPSKYLESEVSVSDQLISQMNSHQLLIPHQEERVRAATAPSPRDPSHDPSRYLNSCVRPSTMPQHKLQFLSPPHLTSPSIEKKKRYGFYEIDGEVDADATVVDIDGFLDQGSEIVLRDFRSPSPLVNPLPPPEVLSRRQLKMIGTNNTTSSSSPSHHSDGTASILAEATTPPSPAITPAKGMTPTHLLEMASDVGELMMVNRAKLLLMQRNNIDKTDSFQKIKIPSTAPPPNLMQQKTAGASHVKPDSRWDIRAATAPQVFLRPRLKSTRLKSSGPGSSVPCRSDSRAVESQLLDPFTITSVQINKVEKPVSPVSRPVLSSPDNVIFDNSVPKSATTTPRNMSGTPGGESYKTHVTNFTQSASLHSRYEYCSSPISISRNSKITEPFSSLSSLQ